MFCSNALVLKLEVPFATFSELKSLLETLSIPINLPPVAEPSRTSETTPEASIPETATVVSTVGASPRIGARLEDVK